ncbi:GNAT family N-acetyltransferase [Streptomyces sp. NBC_01429]|uniref:GNAT family N-acetyltransferase n=1 Tax=Streptomyces sp. NBC_01429 TaxID=2903862 RepID=UPI003FCD3BB0
MARSQFLGAPPEARDGLAEIGFVTTAPAQQGRGVATSLMRHVIELDRYDEFVLREIKDTDTAALDLYRKFGFVEYRRRAVRFARRAGFREYVSRSRTTPLRRRPRRKAPGGPWATRPFQRESPKIQCVIPPRWATGPVLAHRRAPWAATRTHQLPLGRMRC